MLVRTNGQRISNIIPQELTGISRLREALEANDWASNDDDTPVTDNFGDDAGFGAEAAELEKEMLGMRRAIYGRGDNEENNRDEARDESEKENEEDEVEKLEAVMLRMQAVRGGLLPVHNGF
jgi:hypothetical protein